MCGAVISGFRFDQRAKQSHQILRGEILGGVIGKRSVGNADTVGEVCAYTCFGIEAEDAVWCRVEFEFRRVKGASRNRCRYVCEEMKFEFKFSASDDGLAILRYYRSGR